MKINNSYGLGPLLPWSKAHVVYFPIMGSQWRPAIAILLLSVDCRRHKNRSTQKPIFFRRVRIAPPKMPQWLGLRDRSCTRLKARPPARAFPKGGGKEHLPLNAAINFFRFSSRINVFGEGKAWENVFGAKKKGRRAGGVLGKWFSRWGAEELNNFMRSDSNEGGK